MDEFDTSGRRPTLAQLSKTPSWVMLGFIFGAAFVWALPRREPAEARPIVMAVAPAEPQRSEPFRLTTVEAVFDQWEAWAVWDKDVTQVAMWNPDSREFSEYFEVRRINGAHYFRSVERLTNRLIRHGKEPPSECPLRFTETEEQYREWREHGRFERAGEPPARSLPRPEMAPRTKPRTDISPLPAPQLPEPQITPPAP